MSNPFEQAATKLVENMEVMLGAKLPEGAIGLVSFEEIERAISEGKKVVFDLAGFDRFLIDGIRQEPDGKLRVREAPKEPRKEGHCWTENWYPITKIEKRFYYFPNARLANQANAGPDGPTALPAA